MTFIFVLLLFPAYPDPNAQQMNYAVAVLGFVLIFCLAYYYVPGIGGKTFFTGPIRTIDEIEGGNPDVSTGLQTKVFEEIVQAWEEKEVIS